MSERASDIVARIVGLILIAFFLFLFLHPSWSQEMEHRHALGHGDYTEWQSGKTLNCCNNEDCHYLAESDFRETAEGTELKVRGKWCAVKQEHFVIKGKSPDWSRLHACINENTSMYPDDCERILCFMRDSGT